MRSTISTVRSRVLPPAPYVTETKVGCSTSSRRIACQRFRAPCSVLGGKNSKENVGSPAASISRIVGRAEVMPTRVTGQTSGATSLHHVIPPLREGSGGSGRFRSLKGTPCPEDVAHREP